MSESIKDKNKWKERWQILMKKESFDPSPSILVDEYAFHISKILEALGEINANYKRIPVTDESKFLLFILDDSDIEKISKILEVEINHSDKLVDVAKIMLEKG